jgi:hypothetical protein
MAKTKISEKIKNEPPDPDAFSRFKEFTRKILSVRKSDLKKPDKGDSSSTD